MSADITNLLVVFPNILRKNHLENCISHFLGELSIAEMVNFKR